MSRVLFLSQLVPFPLDAGPKVRLYYVLRQLTQKHQVTLLAFSRPDDAPEAIQHLREICEDVHLVIIRRSTVRNISAFLASLSSGEAFTIRRDFLPEMVQAVNMLLMTRQFDVIHCDQLWMAQYALRAEVISPNSKLVLDEHNACFQIIQRLALRERNLIKRVMLEREWRRLREYEACVCTHFDHVVTVTNEDQITLRDIIQDLHEKKGKQDYRIKNQIFSTIPICVDTTLFGPIHNNHRELNVLHLGTMFFLPNVEGVLWFVQNVWPKVIIRFPAATFTIVGKNPPSKIKALANNQNDRLPIHVIGYISDPYPYLERAGVFIVPLLSGGGMRVKIIDAWCWGLPIVSTSIGAEGINYQSGENILIADDPEAFASAIIELLINPQLADKLRTNGRRWVEDHYDWHKVYKAWDVIYTL